MNTECKLRIEVNLRPKFRRSGLCRSRFEGYFKTNREVDSHPVTPTKRDYSLRDSQVRSEQRPIDLICIEISVTTITKQGVGVSQFSI